MKLPLSTTVFLVAATAFITYQATYTAVENLHKETVYTLTETRESPYTKLTAVDDIVREAYIHDIDEESLADGLIRGYLYGINDKYASYMTAEQFTQYNAEFEGEMTGIGVSVIYDSSLGGMYVSSVVENSPAMDAGICDGDIIIAVDGETIEERGYYNTINHITTGKEGEPVSVSVKKANNENLIVEYTLVREVINTTTVNYRLIEDSTVGYIEISSFHGTTADEFINAMKDLESKGAEKYIFDVRSNPGGELTAISRVLDYLLPEGPIIRMTSKTQTEQVINSDADCVEAPMVVLINGSTASAAELFSAALRDYNKATLVGTTTYGKGTVQTLIPLSEKIGGGAVSISTAMYNPPFSDNYEGIGIVPDLEIEIPEDMRDTFYMLPLSQDPQFIAAFEFIKG